MFDWVLIRPLIIQGFFLLQSTEITSAILRSIFLIQVQEKHFPKLFELFSYEPERRRQSFSGLFILNLGHSNMCFHCFHKGNGLKQILLGKTKAQRLVQVLTRKMGVKMWLDKRAKESMQEMIIVQITSKARNFRTVVL